MVHRTMQAMYYNVTKRRVHETIVDGNRNKYYIFLCVCSRACGRGHAWACVRPSVRPSVRVCVCVCVWFDGCGCTSAGVCLRACKLTYPVCASKSHIVCVPSGSTIFFDISQTMRFSKKKVTEYKMCAFVASTRLIRNISHSKKKSARYFHKCEKFSCKVLSFLSDFN